MNKPVRITIFYGLLSGLLIVPLTWLLCPRWGWSLTFKLMLWVDLTIYALLLVRWSQTRILAVLFPLLLLLGAAIWPYAYAGFFLLALGVFSWIRSGICFRSAPLRVFTAELITMVGGAALVVFWAPHSPLAWGLALWLFFLVQALYFMMIPVKSISTLVSTSEAMTVDPFEQARHGAERVIGDVR